MAIDPEKLAAFQAMAKEIGIGLDDILNPDANEFTEKTVGFALFIFAFNGPEFTYISNAQREDMIRLLEELLGRWKRGNWDDFPFGPASGS